VDLKPAIVVDEAQIPESGHEKVYPRACRTHHRRQSRLACLGNHTLGSSFLAEMSQQQENSCQSLFAGIEKLVDRSSSYRMLRANKYATNMSDNLCSR